MWRAEYIAKGLPTYYRTVWADCCNGATRMALRYCRRGYILKAVVKSSPGGY